MIHILTLDGSVKSELENLSQKIMGPICQTFARND